MTITLYSAPGSNSAQRIIWILNYKQLSFLYLDATALIANGSYNAINPFGYVPALVIDGQLFTESMAIAEYLEEQFPNKNLLPSSPLEKFKVREICELINSTIHPPQNRTILKYLRPELDETQKKLLRAQWIQLNLKKLKPRLWIDSAFAIGSKFTLADIFLAVIYRKSLIHGISPSALPEYHTHLQFLLDHPAIKISHPFNVPIL